MKHGFKGRKYCSVLFIDASKAFDEVWRERLISKEKTLNLPLNALELPRNYLTEQKFVIKEKDFWSNPQLIEAGVSRVSVLEFTLRTCQRIPSIYFYFH